MRDAIAGTKVDAHDVLDGNWNSDDAERTVAGWLRMVLSGKSHLDLIGCQNDEMAVGAKKALESVATYLGRQDLGGVMVTGVNGLPEFGQRLVKEGKLVATIVVPPTGATAVELIVGAYRGRPVPPSVTLPSLSYPDEAMLAAGRRKKV
jgi:ABC-type sugar transport system substrate-binding protein